ncbi:hypothetical protein SH580_07285 [Coraliomargarita algicola]|uniref:Uncharacterized protein n=1 Tax=Coraliomargarita algicola TaxID=3092156 RepID=A0ABZ0RMR1_9BACT|nr:hypothetical protein [Coraliomargarita sp. J2-16]WPJ97511.1 hypothetical protein SH580_07285 [Coraliomargarita sp. J2-16]
MKTTSILTTISFIGLSLSTASGTIQIINTLDTIDYQWIEDTSSTYSYGHSEYKVTASVENPIDLDFRTLGEETLEIIWQGQ